MLTRARPTVSRTAWACRPELPTATAVTAITALTALTVVSCSAYRYKVTKTYALQVTEVRPPLSPTPGCGALRCAALRCAAGMGAVRAG